MITVFYDGQCGLCSKEISYYQRIAPKGVFYWCDITQSIEQLSAIGVSYEAALKQLHVTDGEGQMHVAVDAFIIIWSQLKYWKLLAAVTALPLVKPLVNYVYTLFANWRFKRLTY